MTQERAPRSAGSNRRPQPRDAAVWIAAGLDALATHGIDAVRVEPLAMALGVTKGSFYWHFANRRALIDAVLRQWADGRIAAIRQQAARSGEPAAVLRRLADLYIRRSNARGLAIELAIRGLARNDAGAAAAVRMVDRERFAHVKSLFERLGWPKAQARARAALFYGYLFGQSLLDRRLATAVDSGLAIDALVAPPADR